ncbi:MAG: hypothetical protein AB7E61_08020 [Acholeplasmataceae bacterium]
MLNLSIQMLKTKKYMIQFILFLSFFILIYFIIDHLNMTYQEMATSYGIYLVVINIILNLIMSVLSAFLMHMSTTMVELKGKEGKGSSLGFLSILFGILTYGCTSCVIGFFASIGIAFSVIALPLAGLPYKFVSLILIIVGLFVIRYQLEHGKCRVKLD